MKPRQLDPQKSLGGAEFPGESDDPTQAFPDEHFEDRPGLKERRERPDTKRGDSDEIPENVPISFIGRVSTILIMIMILITYSKLRLCLSIIYE